MKNTVLTLTIILISFYVYGQPGHNKCSRHEKIKAEKVAFLTNELDLTVEEAQKFWPLYNEMEDKLEKLRKESREARKLAPEKIETLSDSEIEKLLDEQMKRKEEMVAIEMEYYKKFKNVLPIRKVLKLHQAEKDFTHVLLNKLKGHHAGNPGPKAHSDNCCNDFILED
ncbi:MAG: hypothetical protein Kow0068_00970 [Marinilabiliales bacterium]